MRPSAGDDAFGRPRAADSETSSFGLPQAPQMSFVFADESSIGSTSQPAVLSPFARQPKEGSSSSSRKNPATTADNPAVAGFSHLDLDARDGSSIGSGGLDPTGSRGRPGWSARHDEETMSIPPTTPPLRPSASTSNMSVGMSAASALSSVSSRRGSFACSLSEDFGSHPPSLYNGGVSVGVDGGEGENEAASSTMMSSGSVPQLIMPSIKMPSRRPFTDAGKSMGRLKVLVAGDSGVGKTSLIKAIVQSCEHIVHVDPITPSPGSSGVIRPLTRHRTSSGTGGPSHRRQSSKSENSTTQITEIYASTKPYPEWWSEIDDFRVLQRRKSLGDAVLDRNICFVDTPGYGSGSSSMDTITPVTSYIESHFRRMSSNSLSDGDTLNMIGGEGGVQVDVVLYLVSNRLRPVDVQYLRQLASLTNVIILLAQADLMSPEQIAANKEQIRGQMREADIQPFSFAGTPSSPAPFDPLRQGLYAVSSAAGSDHEIMDASLLMSPDYLQPLIETELRTLVQRVFSQDGASWLRHSAARKYVQWRRSDSTPKSTSLFQPVLHHSPPYQQPATQHNSQVLTPHMGATSSYALARITDHTQREERLAQVRLTNWAADLQRSLENERAQYAALARGERAIWLMEKLNECAQDGTLVALPGRGRSPSTERIREQVRRKLRREAAVARAGRGRADSRTMHHRDPLGLLQVAADLKHRGLVALEVLGSLGLLGGLVIWAYKYSRDVQPVQFLTAEWDRFWGR
ncbi:hypothetical protein QBC47DRAFT_416848 [Echria macrotheca]|uniref:Septin-type G domain-containing protein n=1 Tax=Echria macrotheca TaxID=438768 RepID=A0AAJ0B4J8_9PEZI|nr:hypothetical protein QBC47DRAFT_416848 [Echria macrotheca]